MCSVYIGAGICPIYSVVTAAIVADVGCYRYYLVVYCCLRGAQLDGWRNSILGGGYYRLAGYVGGIVATVSWCVHYFCYQVAIVGCI